MKIIQILKQLRKKRMFQKNSIYHSAISLSGQSNCFSDNKNNIEIGNNCEILGTLYSEGEGIIKIGDFTEIRHNSFIGSVEKVFIGNYVIISNNVRIFDNNNHPTSPSKRKQMCIDGFHGDPWKWIHSDHSPVVIEDNVWIGEYSTILKGVRIGEGSIIACHSVVTKDVPPYSLVAGNPAKVVKNIED